MSDHKLSNTIFDFASDSARKLAEVFPAAVRDGEIDFDALREELFGDTPARQEKYELTWPGKTAAKRASREDAGEKTLKFLPDVSRDPDKTGNAYIIGDCLDALRLLRRSHYGSVKMIYIDPPLQYGE